MTVKKKLRKTVLDVWKTGSKERTIRITGTSMKPFIIEGYTVTVCPLHYPQELLIGDIALFARNSALVAHRIIGRYRTAESISFQEKGDNNFYPGTVSGNDIIGKVIKIDTGTGVIDLRRWYWRVTNLLLGCYWKLLFSLLNVLLNTRKALFGQRRLYGADVIYRTLVRFLVKLPTTLFRLK